MSINAYYRDLERHPAWRGWAFHHFHYSHLSYRGSVVWVDGLYLPRWLHIGVVHRLLGGGDRARSQRFGRFPNVAQRTAHWTLRLIMPMVYAIRLTYGGHK